MSDLPDVLDELFNDPDARRAEEPLWRVIRDLEKDGLKPRAICRALASILKALIAEQYWKWGADRLWAKQYMRSLSTHFTDEIDTLHKRETLVVVRQKILEGEPSGSA